MTKSKSSKKHINRNSPEFVARVEELRKLFARDVNLNIARFGKANSAPAYSSEKLRSRGNPEVLHGLNPLVDEADSKTKGGRK